MGQRGVGYVGDDQAAITHGHKDLDPLGVLIGAPQARGFNFCDVFKCGHCAVAPVLS